MSRPWLELQHHPQPTTLFGRVTHIWVPLPGWCHPPQAWSPPAQSPVFRLRPSPYALCALLPVGSWNAGIVSTVSEKKNPVPKLNATAATRSTQSLLVGRAQGLPVSRICRGCRDPVLAVWLTTCAWWVREPRFAAASATGNLASNDKRCGSACAHGKSRPSWIYFSTTPSVDRASIPSKRSTVPLGPSGQVLRFTWCTTSGTAPPSWVCSPTDTTAHRSQRTSKLLNVSSATSDEEPFRSLSATRQVIFWRKGLQATTKQGLVCLRVDVRQIPPYRTEVADIAFGRLQPGMVAR